MRIGGPVSVAAFIAILILGVLIRTSSWQHVAILTPSIFAIAAFADIATAIVLLRLRRYTPAKVSTYVLAGIYGFSAFIAAMRLLMTSVDPSDPPPLHGDAQSLSYLYVGWKVATALGAIAYGALRRSRADERLRFGGVAWTAAAWIGSAVVILALSFGWASRLPALQHDTIFTATYRFVYTPAIALMCGAAAIWVLRIRNGTEIDHAFAYSVLAIAFEAVLTSIGGERYSGPWYLSRLLFVGTAILVMIAAIHMLLRSREQLHETKEELIKTERESAHHAERIRSLWQIASSQSRTSDARITAILDLGARTIRPELALSAYVSHVDGDTLVIDAAGSAAWIPESRGLAGSLESLLQAGNRTVGWPDLQPFVDAGHLRADLGWRSCVGTPIRIGPHLYFLVFCSEAPLATPFTDDDFAYLDVLAAFVGHQFVNQQQRERIRYQIEHDSLTGLISRAPFRARLRDASQSPAPFAVALVDIDRFRSINESAGHLMGDEILVEVATTLDALDARDLVARLSGDRFGIVIPDIGDGSSRERIAAYAELFRRPFHTGDREGTRMMSLTASIGSALFPADGRTPDDLMSSAEVALDAAKARGGDSIVHFEAPMTASRTARALKVAELSHAIDHGDLVLAYQPTFDLDGCRTTGAEALVRWNHPQRGLIGPADFIPFAERHGLIGRLSRWVIDRVIADFATLPALPPDFRCFVNLASAQVDDLAFIGELESRLRICPRIAAHLGVEITETTAMINTASSMYALDRFHQLGLKIAIDDFGTGYSSLSYLKRLPVDIIKIDRSFVTGLPGDAKDAALCELLLQVAHRFGITALAEGIENAAQLEWLRARGCDSGQGYFVAKPMPFRDLAERLRPLTPAYPEVSLHDAG
jgi:diguanylate cyclase (GGDEF)-like protein